MTNKNDSIEAFIRDRMEEHEENTVDHDDVWAALKATTREVAEGAAEIDALRAQIAEQAATVGAANAKLAKHAERDALIEQQTRTIAIHNERANRAEKMVCELRELAQKAEQSRNTAFWVGNAHAVVCAALADTADIAERWVSREEHEAVLNHSREVEEMTTEIALASGRATADLAVAREMLGAKDAEILELRKLVSRVAKEDEGRVIAHDAEISRLAALVVDWQGRAETAERKVCEMRACLERAQCQHAECSPVETHNGCNARALLAATADVAERWVSREEHEALLRMNHALTRDIDIARKMISAKDADLAHVAGLFADSERRVKRAEATLAAYDNLTPADVRALVESHEEVVAKASQGISRLDTVQSCADWIEKVSVGIGVYYEYDGGFTAAESDVVIKHFTDAIKARDEVGIQLAAAQAEIARLQGVMSAADVVKESWGQGYDLAKPMAGLSGAMAKARAVPGDVLPPVGTFHGTPVYLDPSLPDGYVRRGTPFDEDLVRRAVALHQVSGLDADGVVERMRPKGDAASDKGSSEINDATVVCLLDTNTGKLRRVRVFTDAGEAMACFDSLLTGETHPPGVIVKMNGPAPSCTPFDEAAPDKDCVSLPNGDCIGEGCMHDLTTWAQGWARCSACDYRWQAVVEQPGGVPFLAGLECPACHEPRGAWDNEEREPEPVAKVLTLGTPFDEAATVNPDKKGGE